MKTLNIVNRILLLPFIAAIYLVSALTGWFYSMVNYIKYGGECVIYRKGQRESITGIYELLESNVIKLTKGE